MDLTIKELSPEKIQTLDAIAKSKGKSAEQYVRDWIESEILSTKSFDEILAPIRQGFEESGMSEEDITAMFEQAREEVYQERVKRSE